MIIIQNFRASGQKQENERECHAKFWECHTEDGWKNVLSHNQGLISVK